MYLFIFEDGTIKYKTGTIDNEDFESADVGILNIVDISYPRQPKEYYKDEWHELLTC